MRWAEKAVWSISVLAVAAAAVIMLAMVGLILAEIILRTFFDRSTHMMDELVGYGIGAMSFLALGYSLEHDALIRMNLLLSHLRDDGNTYGWGDRLRGLVDLFPILLLIAIVLGGIYTGLVTPSEAAVLGFVASLTVTAALKQLTWKIFVDSLLGATRITCMVITILVAASCMSSAMGYLHVPQEIAKGIAYLDLGPVGLIVLLGVFYVILGLFLDGLSIMVMTLPITLPLIGPAGFDPVWFGVFLVIMIELGLVTPPIGFNLFVLQGLTGRKMGLIARAAFPFFVLMGVAGVVITIFPEIALWLPRVLFGGG